MDEDRESEENDTIRLPDTDSETETDSTHDPVLTRHRALKKAAVAAAAAGAVWSAPRIEGLSSLPDYASAGTLPQGFTYTWRVGWVDAPPIGSADCWGTRTPGCTGGNTGPVSMYANYGTYGPNGAGPKVQGTTTSPLSPAPTSETVTFAWGGFADGTGTFSGSVNWSLDPPFNSCSIFSVNGSIRGPGAFFGPGTAPYTQNNAPAGITPTPTGANFSYRGTSPGGGQQGSDLTIVIKCNP